MQVVRQKHVRGNLSRSCLIVFFCVLFLLVPHPFALADDVDIDHSCRSWATYTYRFLSRYHELNAGCAAGSEGDCRQANDALTIYRWRRQDLNACMRNTGQQTNRSDIVRIASGCEESAAENYANLTDYHILMDECGLGDDAACDDAATVRDEYQLSYDAMVQCELAATIKGSSRAGGKNR